MTDDESSPFAPPSEARKDEVFGRASIVGGLVLSLVGLPLALRKIRPGAALGFRVGKTLTSDAIWYEVNAIFGRDLVIAGLVIMVVAAWLHRRGRARWSGPQRLAINVGVSLAVVAVTLAHSMAALSAM